MFGEILAAPFVLVGFINGIFAAALLAAVVTVLISRVGAEFPIAVSVRDFWGAIATGFIVQWLGFPWLASRLAKYSADSETSRGAGAPAMSISPTALNVDDVRRGAAIIALTARGIERDPAGVRALLVGLDGTTVTELEPRGGPSTTSDDAAVELRFGIPTSVGAGNYKVSLTTSAGTKLLSTDTLTVANAVAAPADAVAHNARGVVGILLTIVGLAACWRVVRRSRQ